MSASRSWFLIVVHEITGSIPSGGFIKFGIVIYGLSICLLTCEYRNYLNIIRLKPSFMCCYKMLAGQMSPGTALDCRVSYVLVY